MQTYLFMLTGLRFLVSMFNFIKPSVVYKPSSDGCEILYLTPFPVLHFIFEVGWC